MVFPLLLSLLTGAPRIIGAVAGIVEAVTGKAPPATALDSPEAMAAHVDGLPPEQQAAIKVRVLDHVETMEKETTARWAARMGMEGDAGIEKLRATARPQIALRAMRVIYTVRLAILWLLALLTVEYAVGLALALWGCDVTGEGAKAITWCKTVPASLSVTALLAKLEPVIHLVWPSVVAALLAAQAVVRAYMGARERDKARADEMTYGKPLDSTAASIAAAGGTIASIVRAFRK
jgi:hypothetical protein